MKLKEAPITWWIFLLMSTLAFVWMLYINLVSANIFGSDHFQLVLLYENLLSGKTSLMALWEPKGGHRYPGYQLLFFLNLAVGGFSQKIESFIAVFFFSFAAYYLAICFSKSISTFKYLQLLFGALAIVVLFNAQSLYLSAYSLIAMRLLDFAGFILVLVFALKLMGLLSSDLSKARLWFSFVILLCICHLVFGRAWGLAASLSLVCVAFLVAISHRNWEPRKLILVSSIILVVIAFLLIYVRGLSSENNLEINIISMFKYYLVKLGSANISIFSSSLGRNVFLCVLFASVYLVVMLLLMIYLVFYKKVDSADSFAVYLILFSLFSTALVTLSRSEGSPFFPRHNIELSMGFLGIMFLFVRNILLLKYRYLNSIVAVSIGIVALSVTANTVNTLVKYKYHKNYYQKIESRYMALFEHTSSDKVKYRDAGCNLNLSDCVYVFEIIEKKKLLSNLN